jgi:molybdopterin-guanine dinucleotide biosynthesis protein A
MNVKALILAGGESRRMGKPKALLNYFGQPQGVYLHRMLTGMGLETYISCREEQQHWFENIPVILDDPKFANHGPISGLLSAFSKFGGSWLLVGCDYPFLGEPHLQMLMNARRNDKSAVAFQHPASLKAEPLIAIFEKEGLEILTGKFIQGNDSLQHFLITENALLLSTAYPHFLESVDSPEDYKRIVETLGS